VKILLVSWEYPPVIVGGLGRHVYQLATALAADGHEVVVLCRQPFDTDPASHPTTDEIREGVRIITAAHDPHEFEFGPDMMAWILAMGHSMTRAGLTLRHDWTPDVVHAHDWLVAHPSIALAEFFDVPMVSTMHATEAGRHSGWVYGPISRQVHAVESWLAGFELRPWPLEATHHYAQIRAALERSGRPVGGIDLLIAAHALAEDSVVITRNAREFERVPGLAIEVWAVEGDG
jgi:glycosyltransferase involved in cell wall biosynthesis